MTGNAKPDREIKMLCVGLDLPPVRTPTAEITRGSWALDLHNDTDLRELAFESAESTLRLAWIAKRPAYKTPHLPETSDRPTAGLAVLVFTGVSSLQLSGYLCDPTTGATQTLDFFEHQPAGFKQGEWRFVFENDAEVVVVALRCELLLTGW